MKVLIFGIVASGKTTLAKELSKELNILYFEGDCIAWGFPNEKRYKRSDEEQKNLIGKIDENESWIKRRRRYNEDLPKTFTHRVSANRKNCRSGIS